MNDVAVKQGAPPEVLDVKALARKLADAYHVRVSRFKYELGLSTPEAVAKADEPCPLDRQFSIMDCPAEEVTWGGLEDLARTSPQRALQRWEEVKQAAREELQSGHRAGGVLQGYHSHPWHLAQFLAIRAELIEGWQPRNGIERQLIDQVAQAQALTFFLQERLMLCASGVEDPLAAEQAGAMADRFSRIFARMLRALCNLRKVPLAVVVQNAGQVNLAGQQVNLSR